MPKPRNNSSSNQQSVPDFTGGSKGFVKLTFVDGYLNDTDQEWLVDNYSDSSTLVVDLIAGSIDYGGISCKPDAKSGKWLALLFGGDLPETNAGFCLTARASNPHDALYALAYKHLVKFKLKWGNSANEHGRSFS